MARLASLDDIVANGLCIGCGLCESMAGGAHRESGRPREETRSMPRPVAS
jgi:hypothetical protein